MKRLVRQIRDDDLLDADPELLERRREEVMGERTFRGKALKAHCDRVRLPRSDPDGKVSLAVTLLQDHDMLAGEHVHPDTLDHHLHETFGHDAIIPCGPGAPAAHGGG